MTDLTRPANVSGKAGNADTTDHDKTVEKMAREDAEFDGRPWDAMPKTDRERYHNKTVGKASRALQDLWFCCQGEPPKDNLATAALSALSPGDTFVGKDGVECVVVPKEPTAEMIDAGCPELSGGCPPEVHVDAVYRAMLAALTQKENEG